MNWVAKVVLIILLSPGVAARQNYSGNSAIMCDGKMPPASALYSCKGEDPNHSCRAFLIFTATFPYNTVAAIAALTSSDQSEIMKFNNVTKFAVFLENQEVVIPVNCSCSCSGRYYQASTTYQVGSESETYHMIANVTFQGLSTCNALRHANANLSDINLHVGDEMGVPLRCACPTREQAASGTNFLLTYPIGWGDTLHQLSKQFNTSVETISEGNGLPEKSSLIYPFTTILIPMHSEPSQLHTVTRRHDVAMPPLPVPVPVFRNSKLNRILSIGGIAAGVLSLVILMILVFVFLLHKKRQVPPNGRKCTKSVPSQPDLIVEIARLDHNLRVFKFFEIKKATGSFTARNRISHCIYRATFKRKELAVKKSRRKADNEVKMLHQINHFNIVKLHGFCEHKDDVYLIYEYMENGSLHDWLSGRGSKDIMNWNLLIRIALDVANGLLYLHKFTNPARVHNNLSSNNILLDGNLRAKIANFSLAIADNNFTTRIAANKGYIAPECLEAGPVTPKVDIFAYGVILLELVTGKRPVFMQHGKEILLSTAIAASMESLNEAKLRHFIHSGLHENGMEYAIQMIKLSSSCLARDSADRPDMVEIVSILQKLQFNIQKPPHKANNSIVSNIEDESTFSFSTVLPSM